MQRKSANYLIAAFLLLSTGIFIYLGLNSLNEIKELQETGLVTTANVAEHFTEQRKRGKSSYTVHCLRLNFSTTTDKVTNQNICKDSSDFWNQYPVNQQTEILYSPNNYSNFVMGTSAPQANIDSYIFFYIAAIELFMALFFLWRGLKTR